MSNKISKFNKYVNLSEGIENKGKFNISDEDKFDLEFLCEEFGIKNYVITNDGYVDVNGDVDLSDKEIYELPVKFGKVKGNFICAFNQLITLENSPYEVTGNFNCSESNLMSLEGAPVFVGCDFIVSHNNLTSFEGSPEKIYGDYDIEDNQILSLKGFTPQLNGYLHVGKNPIYPIIAYFGPLAKKVVQYFIKNNIHLDRGIISEDDLVKARLVLSGKSTYSDDVENLTVINKRQWNKHSGLPL